MTQPTPLPYQHPPRPAATQQRIRSRDQRANVTIICEARQGIRPWARVRLEDLSPTGFRIAWFKEADKSQVLRIRIPGLEMLSAEVRWHRGDWLGCRFASPLHEAVFAHIVAQAEA